MNDDFRERFLRANANHEFISAQLADVLRNLLRAVAASDPWRATHSAAEQMNFVMELLKRCDQPATWGSLFEKSVRHIQGNLPEGQYDRDYVRAAQDALKYLVESSATDNAAGGRASRRLQEFQRSFERARGHR